ncbi:DUF4123 domain-containing protein [uncultured Pseudomonas sp.]|uniref:DUF4123 domain-containing protein n=1 Tax=uncultured Pseudomonas sp. TaxID=114707 RepID=UPI0025E8408D|nr:DUF4123 domain-containing protein [uncultured Pseudomonas sp.]
MSALYSPGWIDLLETACGQMSITCLDVIIDQAGNDKPCLPSVLGVEPPLPWYSLFNGLPEAGAESLAPLLVRVDLAKPLQRQWLIGLVSALKDRSQLLVLASLWPFARLAEHLSHCLEARNGGYPGVLRYYDPRVFPLLFSHVLQPEQQQRWLEAAEFWSWLDRDGMPGRLLGCSVVPESAGALEPVELSDSQLEVLGCVSDATLVVDSLRKALPEEWGAEQRFQACYVALLEATEAGLLLDSEREVFTLDRLRNAQASPSTKTGVEPYA